MSTNRDTSLADPPAAPEPDAVTDPGGAAGTSRPGAAGTLPLNARSLALSALLGTHPPALPSRALVGLAELFGIAGGTMRTALSRLAEQSDVHVDDGTYRLTGRLLDRQRSQDTGRDPTTAAASAPWDGSWHTIVVTATQRDVADRRRFRASMIDHRFGELRPDVWLRPSNLPRPPDHPDWFATVGPLHGGDTDSLTGRLWDLPLVADTAHALLSDLDVLDDDVDWHDHRSIPAGFTMAATVVRFLRTEPLLPTELQPADWPIERLRRRFDRSEARLQSLLRDFFRHTD